jgi:GH15 family glucan-1,4-alpha-glucosidase
MNAGYYEEACAWRDWLLRAAAGSPSQLQVMYGLAGERRLTEYEVPWLPGYERSAPVRVGNAAYGQLQIDIFGEVMDALHQARRGGLDSRDEDWAFQRAILEHLTTVWHLPDESLEYDTRAARLVGNYPQAFSHIALVNTAHNLSRAAKPAAQRSAS